MSIKHTNFAFSNVATAPSPSTSGTSLVVDSGDGALFPTLAGGNTFNVVVCPASTKPTATNAEVLSVTARSTDTFTIVRAQEGSTARDIQIGDDIYLIASATEIDGFLPKNTAITGATKTKITYDANGLVTSGADATTADIADSTNKRYVTDAQLTVIGNTSGTNTGDQDLSGLVSKTTYDANSILKADSDNTPAVLTVSEQTVVGRATGGVITGISIDSDLSSVSANDDTVPSAKATKAYADLMVPKTLYDANSVLYATTDNTPVALTVGASTIVGRKSTGNIVALTAAETRTILNVADGATANTKATGSELDTGTDDIKFATAKALKDSHNVPSVVPGTAGNVLTSDGTDWTSSAPASVTDMKVTATPGSDHTATGIKIVLTANENQAFGDVCYIDSDGEAHLGDADAIASSKIVCMCADASISASTSGNYLLIGVARDDTWAWTVGGLIYLTVTGTTTNTLSQTAPTGTDDCVIVVGIATHADRMYFSPQFGSIVERT